MYIGSLFRVLFRLVDISLLVSVAMLDSIASVNHNGRHGNETRKTAIHFIYEDQWMRPSARGFMVVDHMTNWSMNPSALVVNH